MRPDTVTKQLKTPFSDGEMQDTAKALVDEITALENTENEKKAEQSAFKERIDRHTAAISELSHKYAKGYEMKDVECDIRYNNPEPGKKTLIRMDTGETVETVEMTQEERQEEIQFNLESQLDSLPDPAIDPPPSTEPPEDEAFGAGAGTD